jgi:hypothetical protein
MKIDHKKQQEETLRQIDQVSNQIKRLVEAMNEGGAISNVLHIDHRWLNIGKTHLQQGLMGLRRAVENPKDF